MTPSQVSYPEGTELKQTRMVSFSNVLMARRPALAILLLQIAFSVGEECLTTGERPKRCVFPFTYQVTRQT